MPDTYLANIPLDAIVPDPTQPRSLPSLSELTVLVAQGDARSQAIWEKLLELATSILEVGLQQPLTVFQADGADKYVLYDGQRRWMALCLLQQRGHGDGTALCQVRPRPVSDADMLLGQININLHRADFNAFEMARSMLQVYESLKDHGGAIRLVRPDGSIEAVELPPDAPPDDIWRAVEAKVGIGRSRRYQIQAVLKLPARVQEIAEKAALPESRLRYLVPLKDEGVQIALVQELAERDLSNAEVKQRIQELLNAEASAPALPMPKPNQIRSAIKPLRQLSKTIGTVQSVPGAISSKDPRTVAGYRKLLPELKASLRELEEVIAKLNFLEPE